MWVLGYDIYKAYDVAPELEVASSCIGALLCYCSDEEPSVEEWFEFVRQEVGV